MEAKHSPAPFRWQNGTLVDARGMGVAKMVPNVYPEQEAQFDADRALLAAAPALLAALSDLTAQCQKWAPTIDRSRAVEALRLARGA